MIDDGGFAFGSFVKAGKVSVRQGGLTVRDCFAISALNGMIASTPLVDRTKVDKQKWAEVAYEFADAMIQERKKEQEVPHAADADS